MTTDTLPKSSPTARIGFAAVVAVTDPGGPPKAFDRADDAPFLPPEGTSRPPKRPCPPSGSSCPVTDAVSWKPSEAVASACAVTAPAGGRRSLIP